MKKLTSIICMVIVAMIMISTFVGAMAAEKYFSNVLIDSNSYTFVTAPLKDTTVGTALIKISTINKADGNPSNYNFIRVKIAYGGSYTTVLKGVYTEITIPSNFNRVGINVPLYACGNDPSLDCRIYGCWNVH